MKVLSLNSGQRDIVVDANTQEHLVLVNPLTAGLHITQYAGSELKLHYLRFPSALYGQPSSGLCNITIEQAGADCRTVFYGMAMLQGEDRFDLTTHVKHSVGGGYSEQLVKFLLADHAHGSFYGELIIAPQAQRTEAHQTNRNVLLSPHARMDTKPQLEIYADDVKASHGATTGQLDGSALFYMQQRGIGMQDARRMLLHAFLSDVLDTLPEEVKAADDINAAFASLNF